MNVRGYEVFIEPISVEAGSGYAAVVAALPRCIAEGDTPEEAIDRVGGAIDSWLAAAAKLRSSDSTFRHALIA